MTGPGHRQGVIGWFIANPVAANLLMILVIVAGLLSLDGVRRELFPDTDQNVIIIRMFYPGASPKEVDEGITVKIEQVVKNVPGIRKVSSQSLHGMSNVELQLSEGFNSSDILDDVKDVVGAINTFPRDAENLTIKKLQRVELSFQIQLYGELGEEQAKALAEEIRRELLSETIVKRADILGARSYEIAVEINESQLQKYNLTLGDVAAKIRAQSINLPTGFISSSTGLVILRVQGQAYHQKEFEDIVLLTTESGTVIRVGDVATVKDDFVEGGTRAYFDRKYSIGIAVMAVSGQDIIDVSDAARRYMEKKQANLPKGVYLASWLDATHYLNGRLNTMVSNLMWGAFLVFLALALFMELRTAFWVMAGLPIGFLGTFILMPVEFIDVSLNMVSLFGFILVVGILVDDAIVVAESVDSEVRAIGPGPEAVARGTRKVAIPVLFGVLTTVASFVPLLFVEGDKHVMLFSIGFVVCSALLFSLMESQWILPSHLAAGSHGLLRLLEIGWQQRLQLSMNAKMTSFMNRRYFPLVNKALEWRYATLAAFLALLIFTAALMASGTVKYVFFPPEPNDYLQVTMQMPSGAVPEQADTARRRIEDAIYRVDSEYQKEYAAPTLVKHLFSFVPDAASAKFVLELTPSEERKIDSNEVIRRWKEATGAIEGASVLEFSAAKSEGSSNLSFMLYGTDRDALEKASGDLSEALHQIDGLSNFSSSQETRQEEYILHLTPRAHSLNLTLAEISLRVKEAFYGIEAQRIQRDSEEVRVMVRYPFEQRDSLVDLEGMFIRLQDGRSVPLRELVTIERGYSQNSLTRVNGLMAVYVSARAEPELISPAEANSRIISQILPGILAKYPGIRYQEVGMVDEQQKMERNMRKYFLLALLGVFVLLAIPLKSYWKPLVIMSAIPFGVVGAIWGHWLLGYPVSMMSLFGIIALSGMVVNDSLVMVDFINQKLAEGISVRDAVANAGVQRFRAVFLTTLTTFLGVTPIILETSLQAQGMIPMAVSLGFGILFATAITLVLVPCLYLILDDARRLIVGKE